ncbi:wax ester/triacylglycerol synthase domain-containing protein [Nonomuraea pusilla]|uniref:Wax ester synthase-like Acyl-CoA acyltransferase domain-containing protein n=1 Tax=Nonomuraea pusilla TaxID=46177 RepID=A0A1H7U699_9ACTN|nr:wax ester/triacylglycerol synthase domain-containing protein [Nonomuraea pusilla]SEL92501.1 Wax ester synthase-like Acyl-CoA acyltransferase domain-containing protein [Nonomuraea pusilla]
MRRGGRERRPLPMTGAAGEDVQGQERRLPPLRLGPVDLALLLEGDAVPDESYWHLGVAARLPGPPPGREVVRELLAQAADRLPALTYRPAGRGARARWEPDPDFDAARHLTYQRVLPGEHVEQAVLDGLRHPLPRDRPLWSLLVLHGHADGEHVVCYRAHHAFQGGAGAATVFRSLPMSRRLPPPAPSQPPPLLRTAAGLLPAVPELLRLLAPRARWHDGRTPGGHGRWMRTVRLDGGPFRRLAAATGATVAQINLAVLSGALRAWSPHLWSGPGGGRRRGLTIWLPVGRGEAGRPGPGSRTGLIAVTLPCAEPSPLGRLRAVMEQAHQERAERVRERQALADHVPHLWMRAARHVGRRAVRNRVVATMLQAPATTPVNALDTFPVPVLPDGVPLAAAFLDLGRAVTVSLVARTSLPRAEQLPPLLEQALEELAGHV